MGLVSVLHFKGRTISVAPGASAANVTVIDEVPAGGTTGQSLKKVSNADYNITWAT